VKNYYDLLQVPADAPAAQIKQAFRQLIARYHPDKVQHLGEEFQALAEERSAELTIAYKTLVDPAQREVYDQSLAAGVPPPAAEAAPAPMSAPPGLSSAPGAPVCGWARADADALRAGRDAVVKRAVLGRVDQVFARAFPASERPHVPGFDLSCLSKPKLFDLGARSWLLAKFVPHLTGDVVQEAWSRALRASRARKAVLSVFVLAGEMGSKRDVADLLAANRRPANGSGQGVTIIPVDVRDWNAWVPAEADPTARTLVARLRGE